MKKHLFFRFSKRGTVRETIRETKKHIFSNVCMYIMSNNSQKRQKMHNKKGYNVLFLSYKIIYNVLKINILCVFVLFPCMNNGATLVTFHTYSRRITPTTRAILLMSVIGTGKSPYSLLSLLQIMFSFASPFKRRFIITP